MTNSFDVFPFRLHSGMVPPELCPSEEETKEFERNNVFRAHDQIDPFRSEYENHMIYFWNYMANDVWNVYYPSSGSDYAPSIAFPNSLVVYADGNEYSMDALKKKRLAAYHEDVTCFDTRKIISEINLLLLFNPVVSFSEIEKNLNLRGYVLCNDYHGNATELGRRSDFEFLWILTSNGGEIVFDADNLDDYWKGVRIGKSSMFGNSNTKNKVVSILDNNLSHTNLLGGISPEWIGNPNANTVCLKKIRNSDDVFIFKNIQ